MISSVAVSRLSPDSQMRGQLRDFNLRTLREPEDRLVRWKEKLDMVVDKLYQGFR